MTDTRSRLADVLRANRLQLITNEEFADVLLSLPGIAIVELPEHEIDPTLLWLLRRAGDEWGPLGVAKAASLLAAAVQAREEQ